MGFNATILSLSRGDVDVALGLLQAERTARADEANESPLSLAEDGQGALIWYNPDSALWVGYREFDQVLEELSKQVDLDVFDVHENAGYCTVRHYAGGSVSWMVSHNSETAPDNLQVSSEAPYFVKEIAAKRDLDAGASSAFEVPVAVFAQLTGFRYDKKGETEFYELDRAVARPMSKPWWKFW